MNKLLSAWLTMMTVGGLVLIAYFLAPFAEALHTEQVKSSVTQKSKACNDRIELIKITCECPGGVNEN